MNHLVHVSRTSPEHFRKRSSSPRSATARTRNLGTATLLVGFALAALSGCAGDLPAGFPAPGAGGSGTGTGGASTGTGGAGGGGSTVACDAPTMYFKNDSITNGCANGACHGPGVTTFGIDLASDGVWDRLKTKTATMATGCIGMPFVGTSKPASGVLIQKVSGMACGSVMPFGQVQMAPIATCITSWVNSQLP